MPKLNACRALVLEYIFEVPHIFLKFRTYISDLMPKLNARRALVLEYIFEVPHIFLKLRIYISVTRRSGQNYSKFTIHTQSLEYIFKV